MVSQWDIPSDSVIPCKKQQDCPKGWNCDGEINFCTTGCEIVNGPEALEASIAEGFVILSWEEKPTNAARFQIQVEKDGVLQAQPHTATSGDSEKKLDFIQIEAGVTYRFRIQAKRDTCETEC